MLALCATPLARGVAPARAAGPELVSVVVREQSPLSTRSERLVRRLGGTVTRELPLIGGFAARVPTGGIAGLRGSASVQGIWADATVAMSHEGACDVGYSGDCLPNTVWQDAVRLPELNDLGYDGDGVAVALLDTGVSRVPDLERSVLARVDLTPEGDGIDRYGHGTHLAGIMVGDGSVSGTGQRTGVAPDAGLVSVKVAGWNGATDVSTVIAGLQWVVSNRDRFGIRVLNLSFGTDSAQSYVLDPLDAAVERVWDAGIFVVTAAGNRGPAFGTVNKPGDDPHVLTVGAADLNGTASPEDDQVAEFSSRGPSADGFAKPDLVAPGITIVSNRAPGSTIDLLFPEARVDEDYFKGTGTSQAAAVVSGIAARIFQASPSLTPDAVKARLMATANPLMDGSAGAGAGLVDAAAAVESEPTGLAAAMAGEPALRSSALGSLDASRGSFGINADLNGDGVPEPVQGEVDVLGQVWDAKTWSAKTWSAETWASSGWSTLVAELLDWDAASAGGLWGGMGWDAKTWSAKTWSELGWDAKTWSAKTWAADHWN